jgi:iron complex transport system ATP-binding protein
LVALTEAGGAQLAAHRVEALSGGEVQRIRLATLIAQQADFWLLDEPGNHLDPALQLSLYEALATQVQAGRGLVLVTHDLVRLPFLADAGVPVEVVCLAEGKVVLRTALDDPGLPDALGEVFGLDLREVEVDGKRRLVVGGRR